MIKGDLHAKAAGSAIRVYFMQRGSSDEYANLPVKIYRRLADDVNFSSGLCGDAPGHWTEYIVNQQMDDKRVSCVFEGQLPYCNSFCSYIDEDAEIGHTYIYWVTQQTEEGLIKIGPTACKLRDREVWWSYERSINEMHKIERDYSNIVQMRVYGESTQHRTLYGLQIGNPERAILLAGAIHASEPGPELLVKAIRFILSEQSDLLRKIGIMMLPTVNVDVREKTVLGEPFYLRKNPNGVDLNRNFNWLWREEFVYGFSNSDPNASTYHGPYAVSENETRAAVRFVSDCPKPAAAFVYDSSSVITEDWLLYDSRPGDPGWERDNKIANLYSASFRENRPGCGSFTASPMHYPMVQMDCFKETGQPHGTFEGWVYEKYGIPSYSVQSAGSKEGACHSNDNVSRELLEQWSRRHANALIAILHEFSKFN